MNTRKPVAAAEDTGTVFGKAAFLEYVDGNLDLAQRAIVALLDGLPGRTESIRKAVASQDSELLRVSAHTLKGAVAFFAAPVVVAAVSQLETIGISGDFTGASAVHSDLQRALERLVPALKEFVREVGNAPAAAAAERRLKTVSNWQETSPPPDGSSPAIPVQPLRALHVEDSADDATLVRNGVITAAARHGEP